jgi:hypothetical protein
MALVDCAEQAVLQWERDDAITMVAIAGAETGGSWANDAQGDHIDDLVAYVAAQAGILPGTPAYEQLSEQYWAEYGPYACNGYTSFGPWQINTRWHYPSLQDRTGSDQPCVWRDYLFNPGGNVSMAREIWESQGLTAWTTYRLGWHYAYIDQATVAVDEALGGPPTPRPLPPPIWPPTPADFLTLPLVDVLAAPAALFPDTPAVEPPPGFH